MGGVGGGSNSSPPSDVAPGGGTYPVDAFGNAYNPAWGGGWQRNVGVVGSGLSSLGRGLSGAQSPIPQFSAPNISYVTPSGDMGSGLIPQTQQQNQGIDIEEVFRRLLGI